MWHLYLDESGDLGFNFAEKHPSRFLTIAVVATSQRETVQKFKIAVRRTLRTKVNRKKHHCNELKGSDTSLGVKLHFYRQIAGCRFKIYAVTVDKARVYESLRVNAFDKSRLYNYLANLVLNEIPWEIAQDAVELTVDKSKSRREIADFNLYIINQLKSRFKPTARLSIYHNNSCDNLGLSVADLFCWGIFRRHERDDREWYDHYQEHIALDDRYP